MIVAIVITRNEEKNIARALDSLSDSRILEIVVSDSNSKDLTEEIVKKKQRLDPRIKFYCYNDEPFTAARGRNEGLKNVSVDSEFILFIDGDMELHSEFLDAAVMEFLRDEKVAAVAGQMHNFFYDDNNHLVRKDYEIYSIEKSQPGGAWLAKRSLITEVGGYRNNLIVNEESELIYRLSKIGFKFKRIAQLMIVHHTEISVSKGRVKERVFDRKVTALSINLVLALQDFGYLKRFVNDNFCTVVMFFSSLCLLLLMPFSIPLSIVAYSFGLVLVLCLVEKPKEAFNYSVYGLGTLVGLIGIFFNWIIRQIGWWRT